MDDIKTYIPNLRNATKYLTLVCVFIWHGKIYDQEWIISYQLKICQLLSTTIQMAIQQHSNSYNSWCLSTAVRMKLVFSKEFRASPNFDRNFDKIYIVQIRTFHNLYVMIKSLDCLDFPWFAYIFLHVMNAFLAFSVHWENPMYSFCDGSAIVSKHSDLICADLVIGSLQSFAKHFCTFC